MILPCLLLLLLVPILVSRSAGLNSVYSKVVVLALPAIGTFFLLLTQVLPMVSSGVSPTWSYDWMPSIGISLDLAFTGWGLLMALLVTGVGSLILIYSVGYEKDHGKLRRLYLLLSLFMFAMVGVTMSDHLMILFLFWELTSVVSYLLIGFYHEKLESRKNALQALLITGAGGLCLLAGFIILATVGGSWNLSELITSKDLITGHDAYPALFTLIAIGALTKSAQFPFHLWLPNAMVAPTPISAYLHSATMVKLGVFLLGTLLPILGGTGLWQNIFMSLGLITFILGGIYGLRTTDLKGILAGTTLAVLGMLVFLLGDGSSKAMLALSILILAHGVYKAALFMVAGVVDKVTGTRDIRILGRLRAFMPVTTLAAILAGVSMMGLPPFYGFIGKEYLYKATYLAQPMWVNGVLILGNALLLALVLRVSFLPFFRKPEAPLPIKNISPLMVVSPVVLAVLGLCLGIAPMFIEPVTSSAVQALTLDSSPVKVALWSGFNMPLLMSVMTVITGGLLALSLKYIARFLDLPLFTQVSPNKVFSLIYEGMLTLADKATRLLQNGYLRHYLIIIMGSALGLICFKFSTMGELPELSRSLPYNPIILITSVLIMASVFIAALSNSKMTSIISLGVIGFGVAMFFAIYSAPDLAITQILVETLTVVIFAWVIRRIGSYNEYSRKRTRVMDAVLATASGAAITLLVLKSKTLELSEPISGGLTAMSYPEGKGSNVVNVTLVDFRALDTLGEIVVLAIASLGVWALLKTISPLTK